ncbi:aKG-HExxH-type peptide beta-hydroxylase [Bradyrhizobium diazoefficiens]
MAARIILLDQIASESLGDEGASCVSPYRGVIDAIRELQIDQIGAMASPFLMMNTNRCLEAIADRNLDLFKRVMRYVTVLAFDSFLEHIPIGMEVYVSNWEDGLIILPNQSISIEVDAPEFWLVRSSRSEIECRTSLASKVTKLLAPPRAIPSLSVAGGGIFLQAASPLLFEPEYIDKVAPHLSTASELAALIGDSLDLIGTVWPGLGRRIRRFIKYYVPIHRNDSRIHNSFSAQNLVGAIFVSESYADLKLAEALVHEFHHNELYIRMTVANFFNESGQDKLYYSPWRADARPLFGLLHALYVFTGVAQFYGMLERQSSDQSLATHCRTYQREVCEKLAWGCAQVDWSALSAEGKELLRWIDAQLDARSSECGYSCAVVSKEMRASIDLWRDRYPSLELRQVRGPALMTSNVAS